MNRRQFLLAGGVSLSASLGLYSRNNAALAASLDIESNARLPENWDNPEINIQFNTFNIETKNIDISEQIEVSVKSSIEDKTNLEPVTDEPFGLKMKNKNGVNKFENSDFPDLDLTNSDSVNIPDNLSSGDTLNFYVQVNINHSDLDQEINTDISSITVDVTDSTVPDTNGGSDEDVIIDGETYRLHIFEEDGTFKIDSSTEVDVLVVGGGGGGGVGRSSGSCVPGSGGGAGGLVHREDYFVQDSEVTVEVGDGGSGRDAGAGISGENGDDSMFGELVAIGGGGGGSRISSSATRAGDGGSGGGGNHEDNTGGKALQPDAETGGLGNDGGDGYIDGGRAGCEAGGGGGAGEPGVDGFQGNVGNGGDGYPVSITGEEVYYAGGGGMGLNNADEYGTGGKGGGADGSDDRTKPDSGVEGKGGGGGGGSNGNDGSCPSSSGGSGIVIVRVGPL